MARCYRLSFSYRIHSGLSQSKVQFARAIPTPSLNRSDKEASFSSVAQVAQYPLANGDLRPKHLTIDNHGDLPNMTTVVILGERGHIMQEVQLKDAKAFCLPSLTAQPPAKRS